MSLETKAIAHLIMKLSERTESMVEFRKDLREFARICEVDAPEPDAEKPGNDK